MKIFQTLKNSLASALLLCTMGIAGTACESLIYNDEGDCDPVYRIAFKYDYNMLKADAFASQVKSLTVYAYDANGRLAATITDRGEKLAQPGYALPLDLKPGQYTFVVWGGLDGENHSYTIKEVTPPTGNDSYAPAYTPSSNEPHPGIDNMGFNIITNVSTDDDGAHYMGELDNLFYGKVQATLPGTEGVHTVMVPLMKDTNRFHVVLQSLTDEDVDVRDYQMRITANDGALTPANSFWHNLPTISYAPYYTATGVAQATTAGGKESEIATAIGELNTSRLVKGYTPQPRLTITTTDNEPVLSIPLIDYVLMVKGKYDKNMSDQEFLDRQDEYNFIFFLNGTGGSQDEDEEQDKWFNGYIYINGWKVVIQEADFD